MFIRGGAVALHAGIRLFKVFLIFVFFLALTSPHTLGGVVALSTWLPLSTTFPKVRFII
jgi:hypothetical protein